MQFKVSSLLQGEENKGEGVLPNTAGIRVEQLSFVVSLDV